MPASSQWSDLDRLNARVDDYRFLPESTPSLKLSKTHKKNTSRDLGSIGGLFESTTTSPYPLQLVIDTHLSDVSADSQTSGNSRHGPDLYQLRNPAFPATPTTPTTKDTWALNSETFKTVMKKEKEEKSEIWDDARKEASPMSTPPGSPTTNQDPAALDDEVLAYIDRAHTDISLRNPTVAPSMATTEDDKKNEKEKPVDHSSFWFSDNGRSHIYFEDV